MKNENEKKGLFVKLSQSKKVKKNSCCCNVELEEIPEEPDNSKNSKETPKDNKKPCC